MKILVHSPSPILISEDAQLSATLRVLRVEGAGLVAYDHEQTFLDSKTHFPCFPDIAETLLSFSNRLCPGNDILLHK